MPRQLRIKNEFVTKLLNGKMKMRENDAIWRKFMNSIVYVSIDNDDSLFLQISKEDIELQKNKGSTLQLTPPSRKGGIDKLIKLVAFSPNHNAAKFEL